MAATKKAAVAALANLDLTKPKQDDDGKLRVDGLEIIASEYRDAHAEIELLTEAQKQRKRKLVEAVGRKRLAEEKSGHFYKTCTITTDSEEVLYVSWADKYKALHLEHEPLLKRAFGKHYNDLFERSLTVKPEDAVSVEEIKKALGPTKFESLCRFLKLSDVLKLRKGFMEARAKLRGSFDDPINSKIDLVVAQVQSDPSFRLIEREP